LTSSSSFQALDSFPQLSSQLREAEAARQASGDDGEDVRCIPKVMQVTKAFF
jgi:hypothetical protein